MPLTNGSSLGSVPDIFVIDLQEADKKLITKKFSAYYFLKLSFSKIKSQKEIKKTIGIMDGFSYYLCLMIKVSGSVPLTSGSRSGSRRPTVATFTV